MKLRKFELVNIFKDKNGKIVIGQWPNVSLWLAIGLYLARYIGADFWLKILANYGFIVAMLYWSYLEVTSGVNTFRKVLGAAVGLYFVTELIRLI